jgi:branched-chain amino acid aminotransferase
MRTTADPTADTPDAGAFGEPLPWVFVDGEFRREPESRVSAHAHALTYGTGTFEGIRATWNPNERELYLLEAQAHFERLGRSARVLGLPLPLSPPELVRASVELLWRNEVRFDAYLRPLLVLAAQNLAVRMHGIGARLSIGVWPIRGDYIDPAGVRCMVSSWRRAPDVTIPSRAKTTAGYLGPALAKTEAAAAGYDEAIMLTVSGSVAEATTANLFVRRGREWLTPPVTDDVLEGITRDQVKTLLAERTGRPVTERSLQRSELFVCDELLLCGTAALVVPVLVVDGRPVGDGAAGQVTRWLRGELRAIAGRTNGRHEAWTTPVYGEGRT